MITIVSCRGARKEGVRFQKNALVRSEGEATYGGLKGDKRNVACSRGWMRIKHRRDG